MVLSYLVSTAGHAQHQNETYPHDIRTIVQLITEGAGEFGDEKVVGFTSPETGTAGGDAPWRCDRYSFKQLLEMSDAMAAELEKLGVETNRDAVKMVSILFPTGLEFLVIWITLMRMGYGVVLVAPQCSPPAILNLHTTTSSVRTIYHPKYSSLAEDTRRLDPSINLVEVSSGVDTSNHDTAAIDYIPIDPDSVSHVFHSSGTSGLPKPIPNTHARSVKVLPRRALPSYLSSTENNTSSSDSSPPPSESAAFTTTPLFHGGVSDLLRGWMARSMVYFYPTSDVPITMKNVVAAVNACQAPPPDLPNLPKLNGHSLAERENRFKPTAFLSVPYILSTLVEDLDGDGMKMLQSMDYVSTGGAPLDTSTGDAMVERGVRLVSRLGSSECGFLLSSHRDYESEKDWELLRNDSPYADALRFEETSDAGPSGSKRYEMVVTSRWSSLTKSNRDDGSYASGDLYEKHPTKDGVWRYVGRGDDVIVMSNGEKASPGPIESLLRTSPELADALVVGSDRSQLGLLLFPRNDTPLESLLSAISPLIHQVNESSPSFAHIATDMCTSIKAERAEQLPKSSKGTIQRGVANEVYKEEIDRLYNGASTSDSAGPIVKRNVDEIRDFILETVSSVAGFRAQKTPIEFNTDLFSWGVNSVMATRVRTAMQKSLNTGGRPLPQNIVFEQPTIQLLADYVYKRQEGLEESSDPSNNSLKLMETLASRYSTFTPVSPASGSGSGSDILLTGATGSLGVHLLHRLSTDSARNDGKIICLVRATDDAAALSRILDILSSRGLTIDESRLVALAADVTKENLGLSTSVYEGLVKTVETVIHAAWPVHFASSLVSFEGQIRGTRNLIDLVRQSPSGSSRFHFCSSIASVLGGPAQSQNEIEEISSRDPATASPIGYSQSKWVVEKICETASRLPDMDGRVRILRIGQLCGDTVTGYWNEKEGWPLLIRTAQTTGSLPDLTEEPSWLPVDLAAQTIIDISRQPNAQLVYHVVHPIRVSWTTVLAALKEAGVAFDVTSRKEWLSKVQSSISAREEDPSSGMLPLWISAYGSNSEPKAEPPVVCDNARGASTTLANIKPLETEDIVRMVKCWRKSGFM